MELADRRFALVVSRDDYNRGSSSVLVAPTTTGGIDPLYLDYYPRLEQFDTRASCRNIRAFKADRLVSLQGSATRDEMHGVIRGGVLPHILSGLFYPPDGESVFAPGTVHNGFITNHRGEVEESWFLVLACNGENGLATVAKVDGQSVGGSKVRVQLTLADGPSRMAAFSTACGPSISAFRSLTLASRATSGRLTNVPWSGFLAALRVCCGCRDLALSVWARPAGVVGGCGLPVSGAGGGIRTRDLRFTKPLLYL